MRADDAAQRPRRGGALGGDVVSVFVPVHESTGDRRESRTDVVSRSPFVLIEALSSAWAHRASTGTGTRS